MGVPLRFRYTSLMSTATVVSMLLLTVMPGVAGDGMPAYRIVDVNDPQHPDLFISTFESRQLARIDLLNSTHERIRLFLSVYSLDPGKNLTIMVPLRTLPVDVTGEPMKESDFREEYLLDRIETEIVEQDPDEARDKLWNETSKALQGVFGSMLLTMPGEYSRQTFRLVSGDGRYKEDSLGGGDTIKVEPQPVQHYEFDGFSIDVFGVDSAGILDDYLAEKGLVIPESNVLDGYRDQYVAVIEAESKPPIDAEDYELFQTNAPNTTELLIAQIRYNPKLNQDQMWSLRRSLDRSMEDEIRHLDDWQLEIQLRDIIYDLVDAIFGSTDFEGEVLTVDLPLDDGNVFFPLGTSEGWPNIVGDIDVLFRVPEDKDLVIEDTEDAYLDGHHWYLFQMEMANPGFDLESQVMEGDEDRRVEASRSEWMYENSVLLGYLFALSVLLVLWFGFAVLLRRTYGIEGRSVRDPTMWGMMALSVIASIPGALLIYFMLDPIKAKEIKGRLAPVTAIAMYPAAVVMFVLGVVL
ncbi:MAG: hypothetical protein JSW25_08770 [Thermoplasmata archaeon]|nr:MAG: hypothetical protein JSW25_08770 [Thermoplasmata archaeon]